MFYKRESMKNEKFIESQIMTVVKRGIIGNACQINSKISSKTQNEIHKAHEFLQKRMRFGQVFEATLPFSAILLDSNLKVIWGNDNFFQDWGLSNQDYQTHLGWDSLRQLTNLGQTDPILDASKNGMAGIFQIQVNLAEKAQPLPYEMYVHPVDSDDERNIMVYFYPCLLYTSPSPRD